MQNVKLKFEEKVHQQQINAFQIMILSFDQLARYTSFDICGELTMVNDSYKQ